MEVLKVLQRDYSVRVTGSDFSYAVRKCNSAIAGHSHLKVYLLDIEGKHMECRVSSTAHGSFESYEI